MMTTATWNTITTKTTDKTDYTDYRIFEGFAEWTPASRIFDTLDKAIAKRNTYKHPENFRIVKVCVGDYDYIAEDGCEVHTMWLEDVLIDEIPAGRYGC